MITNPPTERWRLIPGFEGCDEVSPDGRVRGVDRLIIRRNGPRTQPAIVHAKPQFKRICGRGMKIFSRVDHPRPPQPFVCDDTFPKKCQIPAQNQKSAG